MPMPETTQAAFFKRQLQQQQLLVVSHQALRKPTSSKAISATWRREWGPRGSVSGPAQSCYINKQVLDNSVAAVKACISTFSYRPISALFV